MDSNWTQTARTREPSPLDLERAGSAVIAVQVQEGSNTGRGSGRGAVQGATAEPRRLKGVPGCQVTRFTRPAAAQAGGLHADFQPIP